MKRVRIKISDSQIIAGKEHLRSAVLFLKDGEYAIDIKKWSGSKTWEQIKAIHGILLPAYSEYTGLTIEEAKRYAKMEFGEKEYFDKDGQAYVELKSFAAYSKTEMRSFIDKFLHHLEYDCNMIFDFETRQQLRIDIETGELIEVSG